MVQLPSKRWKLGVLRQCGIYNLRANPNEAAERGDQPPTSATPAPTGRERHIAAAFQIRQHMGGTGPPDRGAPSRAKLLSLSAVGRNL